MKTFDLDSELTASLQELSRTESCTLFMTMVSALQTLLYHHTHREDMVIGTDTASRVHSETEDLIGFFTNQLVLRNRLSGDQAFHSLMNEVRRTTLDAYAHDHVPFNKLVEHINPGRDRSRSPLFQVKIVFQNVPLEEAPFHNLGVTPMDVGGEVAQFDILLILWEKDNQLYGRIEYYSDLYTNTFIDTFLSAYKSILSEVVTNPKHTLNDLDAQLRRQQSDKLLHKRKSLFSKSLIG